MGEQDWTINERGEVRPHRTYGEDALDSARLTRARSLGMQVINEEGLPMFDIHEDLPAEPVASTSRGASASGAATTEPPKRRFLIKKGGKQTIGKPCDHAESSVKS